MSFLKHKIHRQDYKHKSDDMIGFQTFIFEYQQGKDGKNRKGNNFLNNF